MGESVCVVAVLTTISKLIALPVKEEKLRHQAQLKHVIVFFSILWVGPSLPKPQ
jgi:hypothetical protein